MSRVRWWAPNMRIVLVRREMRYAFITALSSGAAAGEVVIADMESFLHRVITQDQGPYERQGSAQLLERLD
jgi:hypothetical protein